MRVRACIIAKNEAAVIGRSLASISGKVDSILLVDTGSTDGTMELARAAGAAVVERPWISFGHNRTEILELAADGADYLLILDADQTLEGELPASLSDDAYHLELQHASLRYDKIQLVRAGLPWTYEGATHEFITCPGRNLTHGKINSAFVIEHADSHRRTNNEKFADDLRLLKQEYAKDPNNARTTFYLARTYDDMGDKAGATYFYSQRLQLPGWIDEVFYSRFRLGVLDLPNSLGMLLSAMDTRPGRWEPVHAAAKWLNEHGSHAASYALTGLALSAPEKKEGLFVSQPVYDYLLEFEHSISSFYVGQYRECKAVSDLLLSRPIPDNIREALVRNMAFLEGKI